MSKRSSLASYSCARQQNMRHISQQKNMFHKFHLEW